MIFKKKKRAKHHKDYFPSPTPLRDFLSLIFTAILQIDLCNEEISLFTLRFFSSTVKTKVEASKKSFYYIFLYNHHDSFTHL